MPFVVFFVSIAGGLVLERWLRSRQSVAKPHRMSAVELVLACSAFGLLLWHAILCVPAFYIYHAPIYPELPGELKTLLWQNDQLTGRVASWAPERSGDEKFFALLPQDIPAIHELPIRGGYNPLLSGRQPVLRTDPWKAMQAYGIAWHFIADPQRPTGLSSVYSQSWKFEVVALNDPQLLPTAPAPFETVFSQDGVVVKKLTPVAPLAFAAEEEQLDTPTQRHPLPISLHGGGIDVAIQGVSPSQVVIVNFRHWAGMTASVDGRDTSCVKDSYERMFVRLPAAGETLSIRYRPTWATGIWMGLVAAALGAVFAGVHFRRRRSP
jgi:hypothetical protein